MNKALKEYLAVWLLNHVIARLGSAWTVLGWASLETGTFEAYAEILKRDAE